MASFIAKLFSKNGDKTLANLRGIIAQNETDRQWADSFRAKAVEDESELQRLLGEFRDKPSDGLATEILTLSTKAAAEKPALVQLSEMASAPIKAKILERTLPAVRSALEMVKERLETELEASRKRDADFDGSSMRGFAGEINVGYKTPEENAAAVKSSATRYLETELERATGYLSRLDSLQVAQLKGPIEFCLGEAQ